MLRGALLVIGHVLTVDIIGLVQKMEGGIQKHLLLKRALPSLFSSFALFSLSLPPPPPLFAPATGTVTGDFLDELPNFQIDTFSELEEHSGRFAEKKLCLCRNFISIYKINRTLRGRLGIRILSSGAESNSHSFASLTRERYFQHEKMKFASPRGHVISSISAQQKQQRNKLQKQVRNIRSVRVPLLSNQTTIWH